MKIGIQTISWGVRPKVTQMLSEIKGLGFKGIEVSQHPSVYGLKSDEKDANKHALSFDTHDEEGEFKDPSEFLSELKKNSALEFLGIAGGRLEEKVNFSKYVKPHYIYVEDWDDENEIKFKDSGFVFALHPHMFKKVQTWDEAKEKLNRYKNLHFLPDTAHLTVAGDNILDVIKEAAEAFGWNRIPAIHWKDWSPDYGRSYQFYSKGFVEIGRGMAPLDKLAEYLRNVKYSGWLVFELDHPTRTPQKSAEDARMWLINRNLWQN